MSPIILSWSDQLCLAAFWMLSIFIAYLQGGNVQLRRHIATLKSHIAFLRSLGGDEAA